MHPPISPKTLLHQRYFVLETLRQGRGGWIYLAEDQKRGSAPYILEEWQLPEDELSPDLQNYILDEFQSLIQLRHPQIPRYRVAFWSDCRLYFVRHKVDGETYGTLLKQKLAEGLTFSESEILVFLQQVIAVLNYLHKQGVVHQNLTLENVYRSSKGWSILVGFGLKSLQSFIPEHDNFAPFEQRIGNRIARDTDLYAVAAIATVLLTGYPPEVLYDETTLRWTWLPFASVSPQLAHVLDRMLSPHPPRRYASAVKVMQALVDEKDREIDFSAIAVSVVLIGLAAIAAWRIIFHIEKQYSLLTLPSTSLTATSEQSPEVKRSQPKKQIELTIDHDLFSQLVNHVPSEIVLEKLSLLSSDAQKRMGSYKRATYNTWLVAAKQRNVSSRSLETLTDAQLVAWFPQLQGKKLEAKTWGQVWYAIAQDQSTAIQTQAILKTLPAKTQLKETLDLGQGNVYLIEAKQGQTLRLEIAAAKPIRLSIFPPPETAFPLLRNSTETTWTGKVQQSGIYEIIVTPTNAETVSYSLKIDKN